MCLYLRGQGPYSVKNLTTNVDLTVSSPKKVDLSFLSDSQRREYGPRLNLLIGHIRMTRKYTGDAVLCSETVSQKCVHAVWKGDKKERTGAQEIPLHVYIWQTFPLNCNVTKFA